MLHCHHYDWINTKIGVTNYNYNTAFNIVIGQKMPNKKMFPPFLKFVSQLDTIIIFASFYFLNKYWAMVENHFLLINFEFNFFFFFDNHLFSQDDFFGRIFSQIFIQKNHPRKKLAFGMFILSVPNPLIKLPMEKKTKKKKKYFGLRGNNFTQPNNL